MPSRYTVARRLLLAGRAKGGKHEAAPCFNLHPLMNHDNSTPLSTDRFRRSVLLVIIVAGLLATVGGWYVMQARGALAPTLVTVQAVTTAVLSALFIVAWLRWLPQRVLELCCLLYIVGVCVACMGLRMYS